MKPVKLFKKFGVAVATGLLTLGIVAGTAAAAQANSSDIGSHDSSSSEFLTLAGNSSDIGSHDSSSSQFLTLAGNSSDIG
ncbi:hypothetical protein [Glycomyces sp. YM15]|uniref:hypothetical protein n=1 Tax=Glycomyces sp. YM15 TaxID=2800446 RepID=UPI00196677EE|nr:hypothetical protein [Glycomyces sp. YM15]